jgi:hypothetical protein
MIKGTLFSEEELKKLADKYGFIYEPDRTKCKSHHRIPVMFISFYVKDGVVDYGEPGFAAIEPYSKDWILEYSPVKYINAVYVEVFDQEDQNKLNDWNKNYHGHVWVKAVGHTPFTDEEIKEKIKREKPSLETVVLGYNNPKNV